MDISSRVDGLSPDKRTLLALRISQHLTSAQTEEIKLGGKRLVAYTVPSSKPGPTISELRQFLREKLPDYMVPSTFVTLDTLPRTPNGKVDRGALPAPEAGRSQAEQAFIAPGTATEGLLAGIWSKLLNVKPVGIHDNFFELGGDSILSIQIVAKAKQAGLRLTAKDIFDYQTVAELARVVGTTGSIEAEQNLVTGQVPLTPIQHWFFEQNPLDPHHANISILVEIQQTLDAALLEQVIQKLLDHHDALRLRFAHDGSGWRQVNAGHEVATPVDCHDLSGMSDAERDTAIEVYANKLQTSLNLSDGPLVRVALFEQGAHKLSRLLFVIHHLVFDVVSWWILFEDLQTACELLSHGEPIRLPPKTTSFKSWAEKLTQYVLSETLQQEHGYWLAEPKARVGDLPVDFPDGRGTNTFASARTVTASLSVAETQALLQEVPKAYRTQIDDVLLTALLQTVSRWTGQESLLADLEGHGREEIVADVDLARTIGWFTTVFPVLLEVKHDSGPGDALQQVKEQLRRVPNRGIGYGLLRYLGVDTEITEKLRSRPQAELNFNYLGQFDQALSDGSFFRLLKTSSGADTSPRRGRTHLLEIVGIVSDSRLHMDWTYSANVHRRSTIERLAHDFLEALRALITHCKTPKVGGYVPSDYADFEWNEADLDNIAAAIRDSRGGA